MRGILYWRRGGWSGVDGSLRIDTPPLGRCHEGVRFYFCQGWCLRMTVWYIVLEADPGRGGWVPWLTPKELTSGVGIRGVLARRAVHAGHLFLTIPHSCLFLPPPHKTIWSIFSPCLRIWPILCTQFMTMVRVVVGSGGSDILCC